MTFWDWLDERKLFGIIILLSFVALLGAFIYTAEGTQSLKVEAITIISAGLGSLGTAVGIIVQAIWKTSSIETHQTEALANIASGESAKNGAPPPAP